MKQMEERRIRVIERKKGMQVEDIEKQKERNRKGKSGE